MMNGNSGSRLGRVFGVLGFAGVSALVASACSPAAWDTSVEGAGGDAAVQSSSATDCAPKKLEGIDINTLEACCTEGSAGAAHCVPKEKATAGYRRAMSPCGSGAAAGFCIPDALIRTNGAKPPGCTTQFDGVSKPGACVSVCVPAIASKKDLLEKRDCAGEDEKCAPCISPLDGKASGACEIGTPKPEDDCKATGDGGAAGEGGAGEPIECPYKGPLIEVKGFPACDPAGARCVPESQVPEKQRGMLKKCETGLCVPEKILAHRGQYIPDTCSSVAGNEGRCMHVSVPFVSARGESLPRDTCSEDEKCAPCTDPTTGKETGACKIACDPGPKKAPVLFPGCCGGLAKCVPTTSVPAAQQASLNSDGCDPANKCVPTEMLAGPLKPQKCTPGFFAGGGAGVCLSTCIELGFIQSLVIGQEDCGADHQCVPCMFGGKPSGAPGCN